VQNGPGIISVSPMLQLRFLKNVTVMLTPTVQFLDIFFKSAVRCSVYL